jgi:dynein heavy chain
MHKSLYDLKRALLGEIGISGELEELLNSLYNGFLPTIWALLAP